MMDNRTKWGLRGGAVLCGAVIATAVFARADDRAQSTAQAAPQGTQQIEPQAEQVLRGMSEYLAQLRKFTLVSDSVDEVVLQSGQKLQFPSTSQIYVQRPNRLRSDRVGGETDASLFYDGSKLSLLGRKRSVYASTEAPATLDGAIGFARKDLQMDAPGADLLYSTPYDILSEDVVSGRYLGEARLDGVNTHHLAFEGNETNWEIWIEDGPRPLPRRFVITSKKVLSHPQFTVSMHDWNVSAPLSDETFTFKPSEGARQLTFKEVWDQVASKKARLEVGK
jgi:hypothetical protein